MSEKENKRPSKELKCGNCKLVVWTNTKEINGKNIEFDSINFEQFYKNKEDKWESNSSFNGKQLLLIKRLIDTYLNNLYPVFDNESFIDNKKEN